MFLNFAKMFLKSQTEPLVSKFFNFNVNIDILRDDLIHPIVSGNKWRKLEFIVEDFKKSQAEILVTFGGAFSNHLVATAVAGQILGFKTFGFVRGDEKRDLNYYETVCINHQMTLEHVSRRDYKNKTLLFENKFKNENAYFVDEGGNHPLALKGCQKIIEELNQEYDYIVLSIGTGTTMEGLVQGVFNQQLKTKIIGISALKNNFDLNERLKQYPDKHYKIFHEYHRGKYGQFDDELLDFIKEFYLETNIKTDPIYTAKMLLGVKDLYFQKILNPNDKVLIVHTGGILAFNQQ